MSISGHVPVAVQMGGLHSGLSQFFGSWHLYLNLSSQATSARSINKKISFDFILYILYDDDMKISNSIFHELFFYDQKTGNILQKKKRPKVKVGEIAGSITPKGYRYIQANGRKYAAHHLVWYFETGSFPTLFLDHIDGNKLNNHFSNLREVTIKQNNEHRGKQINNTTGYKGVTYNKRLGKFIAQIQHNYKTQYLGVFESALEASQVYEKTAKTIFSHY